jgi:hypothetical protein
MNAEPPAVICLASFIRLLEAMARHPPQDFLAAWEERRNAPSFFSEETLLIRGFSNDAASSVIDHARGALDPGFRDLFGRADSIFTKEGYM